MTLRESAALNAGMGLAYLIAGWPLAAGLCFLWAAYLLQLDLKKLVIEDKDGPYLTRWHLFRCRWFRVFVHRIHRPDKDRHVHNHPWPCAAAFILRGGYSENITHTTADNARTTYGARRAFGWSRMAFSLGAYHRIVSVLPNTWTIFFAGRRSRDWGFLQGRIHVPCRQYLGLPLDHDFGD